MKIKTLCCSLYVLATVLLCACLGCNSTISYPFHYDESEIKSISIIYIYEGYYPTSKEYETLVKIEDKESFLIEFKKIQFRKFQFGDPESVESQRNAILVEYYNSDYEIITPNAHDVVVNGAPLSYGRENCDEEDFNNFINSYLTNN